MIQREAGAVEQSFVLIPPRAEAPGYDAEALSGLGQSGSTRHRPFILSNGVAL